MAILGNALTRYRYAHKALRITTAGSCTTWNTADGSIALSVHDDLDRPAPLPDASVFHDWSEARRYVGPLPFTFSHDAKRGQMLIVEGSRTDWMPRPVIVEHCNFRFLNAFGLSEMRLSNAFAMDHVPYCWEPGIIEPVP
jgi:hypothetical protein